MTDLLKKIRDKAQEIGLSQPDSLIELALYEALLRRAAIVGGPFMLKGSLLSRQFMGEIELTHYRRTVADLDWVCLQRLQPDIAAETLTPWMIRVTDTVLDDGIHFRSFSENSFWRSIEYAMDDDFPTVNTDIDAFIGDQPFLLDLDISFNLKLSESPQAIEYRGLFGDTFPLPSTTPINLQVAWKLHQTLVRPRFKDLYDLGLLLFHPTLNAFGVWRALTQECESDRANPGILQLLLGPQAASQFAQHPALISSNCDLQRAWQYWRHGAEYRNSWNKPLMQEPVNWTLMEKDRLPADLESFLRPLSQGLERSGLADLIRTV